MENTTPALKPGDLVVVTSRSNRGEERCAAVITAVDGEGACVMPRYTAEIPPTGSGWFRFDRLGARYGLVVAVEVVGHRAPVVSSPPVLAGNRGYTVG